MTNPTDLVPIPVPGTDRQILAVEIDGKAKVSIRHACEAMGIDTRRQIDKLKRRSWACVDMAHVNLPGDIQRREVAMIDRRTLTMWLATIDETKVSDEARPILIAFQAEAADALDAYFHAGGAINPRATEDQLEIIARRAQSQAAVLNALCGVVDAKHLDAKGRIILAQAMGEKPEVTASEVPLYVSDFLKSKGLKPAAVASTASTFGKRLKGLYIAEHGDAPEMHLQNLPNGQVREACAYTEADRDLFEQVWTRHYAEQDAA